MKSYTPQRTIIIILIILAALTIMGGFLLAFRQISEKAEIEALETDVFISSGGLGGSSAAIELAKQGISFVMIEETDWLGGQATSQGVSSLDDNNRGFQKSGVYQEILNEMMVNKDTKTYIANAATGPGAPPKKIHEIISDKLKANSNNIYLESKIIKINYNDKTKRIKNIVFEDKNKKQYEVTAKFYLDSSDFSELTKASGIEIRYGLDSLEDINEFIALTHEQKGIFTDGANIMGQNVGGFGNKGQSITSPMMLADLGYVGYRFEIKDLVNSEAKIISCLRFKDSKCVNISEIGEIGISLPSKQKFILTILLDGKYDYFSANNIEIVVDGKSILDSEKTLSSTNNFSFLSFPAEYNSTNKISIKTDLAFRVSDIIAIEENKFVKKATQGVNLDKGQEFTVNGSDYFEIKPSSKEIKNLTVEFPDRGENRVKNIYDGNSTIRFIGKNGEKFKINFEGEGSVQVTRLNRNHYFAGIFENFEPEGKTLKYELPSFQSGFFKVYLEASEQSNNFTDTVSVKIKGNNDEILNKEIEINKNSLYEVGEIRLNDFESLNLQIETTCDTCFRYRILLDENLRAEFDSAQADRMFRPVKFHKKLFSTDKTVDFFAFRRTIDPENLNQNNLKYVGITKPNQFISGTTGITYINILQNDYSFDEIDYRTFYEDKTKRNEIVAKASQKTKDLYYWMKYDHEPELLACGSENIFCSGLRMAVLPDGMGTDDGISKAPYIRETARPKGQTTLTANDFFLMNQLCAAGDKCVSIKFGNQVYDIKKEFLSATREEPVLSFYYPTDHHIFVSTQSTESIQKLNEFNDYMKNIDKRDRNIKPYFWSGMFELRIKPSSISIYDLFSVDVENVMFCGKNISVSQVANGSTRLHPAESMVGEVCGVTAAYAIKNKLTTVHEVAQEYEPYFEEIIKSGLYPLPYDDMKINYYMNNGESEIPTAYFLAWYDKILEPKVEVQRSTAMYYFDSLGIIKKSDINKVFEEFGIKPTNLFNSNFETITFSRLENILSKEDFKKWQKFIIDYRCKDKQEKYREKSEDYCNKQVFPKDSYMTRGDLAYVYLKLKSPN